MKLEVSHVRKIANMTAFLKNVEYFGISDEDLIEQCWINATEKLPECHEAVKVLKNWCMDKKTNDLVEPIVLIGMAPIYQGFV